VVVVAVGKRASRQRGSSAVGGGSKGSKDGKKGKRRKVVWVKKIHVS
jgi:hypothetical protein